MYEDIADIPGAATSMNDMDNDCASTQAVEDRTLDRLFRAEAPRLARFLRRSISNHDEVHDLVQDTFVSFVSAKAISRLRSPEAYLRTIARHLLWGRVKGLRLRDKAVHLSIDDVDLAVLPQQEWMMEASDFLRRYEEALAELPERTRTVFRLHRQEELTYHEIADRMGITERGVKYHMKKALIYLDRRVYADD
ncbi:sigma-70 family RNA polymerase sigma factor [Novosphingobium sp. BL-52-GroH]|uniref:sigma-70 family RNA polymerase sigma factor n=1 Tax=Novosphingobium sp. BL-52-GroH TaxID=3349877 RepID=UPI00384FEA78